MTTANARKYSRLTSPEVPSRLDEQSVLCLPLGSLEQHGPHLPLNTDTVIAEQFTARLVDRYRNRYDLWSLPCLPYGLSPEHTWARGTVSMTIAMFAGLLDAIVGEYARATSVRKLLIVNGHGGNRGVLKTLVHELRQRHGVAVCVVHPGSLSTVPVRSKAPEIHAGVLETSVMLALVPDDVQLDRVTDDHTASSARTEEIHRLVLDRATTWPWSSGDTAVSADGVIGGDPRTATAELGHAIIASALDASSHVLARLVASKASTPSIPWRAHAAHR